MRRTTILVAATAGFALLALGLGSHLRADEPGLEGRVAALEKEVAALKARLDKLEGAKAAKPAPRRDRAARIEDLNKLRQFMGLILLSDKTPLRDGALDPYAFARNGDIDRTRNDMFRSVSMGTGPPTTKSSAATTRTSRGSATAATARGSGAGHRSRCSGRRSRGPTAGIWSA